MKRSQFINPTIILLVSVLFLTGASCPGGHGAEPTPTPTQAPTAPPTNEPQPTPTPTIIVTASPLPTGTSVPTGTPNWSWPEPVPTLGPLGCEPDRDAIQAALYAYNASHGEWPTADGEPGDIVWSKLIPQYLPKRPQTDLSPSCDWHVNIDPEGEVCVPKRC
jgi:hypothetical protein